MIPAELPECPQWVVWRAVKRDGKITKPPFMGTAPDRHASTTDSATWCTYAEALAAVEAGLAEGVGFVFTGDDDFVGIDFDKCRDPETGEVSPSVAELISVVDSYTEVSPSGTGVHVIARGHLPGPGRKRDGIEIYGCGRYFTMTGVTLNGLPPGNIEKRQAAVEKLWNYLAPTVAAKAPSPPVAPVGIEDHDLLDRARRARNGDNFARLYDAGAWQGVYGSQSEADLSLCGLLAFWTGRDPVRVDQLFRACALMRTKWDRSAGQGETYGQRTVRMAVEGTTETYAPADHLAAPHALDGLGPQGEQEPAEPPAVVRFVPLGEYVANPKGSPDALLGEGDDVLLPVGGLVMNYGDAGAGKTTFDVHAVAHLASGTDWLGITVARPVKIALIQNEGPAEPWRRKLERKLETWTGEPWSGNVLVLDEPHGGFDFRIPEHREAIRELRRQGVELIVADPTKWLGAEGGGTPAEVLEFVALLKECGLHSGDPNKALAFWLAHHENKSGEISGAWRADPDTLIHIEANGLGRTKATFEKCRWASGRHGQRMILAWADGEGYEVIETSDRPTMSGEEVDAQVLAFIVAEAAEGRRCATTKVRKAIPVRSERTNGALERLKEKGEIADLDQKGGPHPGTTRTPRYWIPSAYAGFEVVRPVGTTSDHLNFEPQTGESGSAQVVPWSRTSRGPPTSDHLDGATLADDNPRCSTCGKRERKTEPGEPTCRCGVVSTPTPHPSPNLLKPKDDAREVKAAQ